MADRENADEDIFATLARQSREFISRARKNPLQDLVGVVDAAGCSAVSLVPSDGWRLVMGFSRWKVKEGTVEATSLRAELPGTKKEVDELRPLIRPHEIIHIRGRVAEHPAGHLQSLVDEVVAIGVHDIHLAAAPTELEEPVVLEHARFGRFTLDRSIRRFEGVIPWSGRKIALSLPSRDDKPVNAVWGLVAELLDGQHQWFSSVRDVALKDLLGVKNEHWLGVGEAKLTPAEFIDQLALTAISIHEDESLEFYFDGGSLFHGHQVLVSASLAGGVSDADIVG